jgi:hypothetical protein
VDNKKSAKKVSLQSRVSNATPLGVEESQPVEEVHDHKEGNEEINCEKGYEEDLGDKGSCKEEQFNT